MAHRIDITNSYVAREIRFVARHVGWLVAGAALGGAVMVAAPWSGTSHWRIAGVLTIAAVVVPLARVLSSLRPLRPSWAGAGSLEDAVIAGRYDLDDPVAARRVARLTSRRSLRGLARGLRKAMAEGVPANGIRPIRLVGDAANDPLARDACLALADALDRAVVPDPDVIVRVVRLLRDPDSALAGDCAARLAQDASALRFRLLLDE